MQHLYFKVASLSLIATAIARADQPRDGKLPQIFMATLAPQSATAADGELARAHRPRGDAAAIPAVCLSQREKRRVGEPTCGGVKGSQTGIQD
jgi:hypothetical protein